MAAEPRPRAPAGDTARPRPRPVHRRALALLLTARARLRRRAGRYDRCSLALHRAAWRLDPTPAGLLRLAGFRRDLGRPLPRRWCGPLLALLRQGPAAQSTRAAGLLAEVQALPPDMPRPADSPVPALRPAPGPDRPDRVAELHRAQDARRTAFAAWLRTQAAGGGVCVVGNAASLLGQGLGRRIDGHAAVMRFNACGPDPAHAADLGSRLTLWGRAPNHAGLPPATPPAWTLLSGPDLRFRPLEPATLAWLATAPGPVLTVPLPIWRTLVAQLQAPPSAGLLALAWLRSLLGSWSGLRCAGLGRGLEPRYHALQPGHRPASRHAWAVEAALLAQWTTEGLQRLDDSTAAARTPDAPPPPAP